MANDTIDPFTGLPDKPVKDKIDPFTGKKDTGTTRSSAPYLSSPEFLNLRGTPSSYESYGVPTLPGLDLDEMRAQRQSKAEKWGRGLMKAGVTMAGAVAENTVGLMDGIGEAIVQGDWTKIYDNETGRAIDSMNAWMQENYPNYYTKEEQNAIGLENLGYANFWGDKAANGLGYAVASVATLAMTGGVGLIARGAGLAAKAAKASSKGLSMYNAAKSMATGAKIGQKISSGARRASVINAAKTAEVGIAMSHAEASVEAREMLNHAYAEAALDIAESRGVTVQELTASEKQEARDLASSIGNYGYAFNMAVLAPTNLFMFGKGLFPKYGKMRPKAKGYRQDKLGKWRDTWAKEDSPMWKRTASRYLRQPGENAISETFQEGTQYAIQRAGESSLEKGGPSGLLDFSSSVIGGWEDTLTDKEGIESLMLGFIIGGFMGGAGSARSRWNQAEEDKGRAKIIKALNSEQMYTLAEKAEQSKKQEAYSQAMQKALEDGDHKAYRDAQFSLVLSQIAMHDGAGTIDMYLQKIDDAKRMEPAEFAKAFGIPEGVEFDQARIASDLTKDVKKFVEMKEKVELMFPSSQKTKLAKLLSKKEVTEEEKQQAIDEHKYKSRLILESLRLEDNDSRIEKLTAELNQLFTPLEQEQRVEAERLVKRLQYNSSKIRRLEKKKRNSPEGKLNKEDQQTLNNLYAELNQAKDSLAAETIETQELEADKQQFKKRSTDPESLVSEETSLLEQQVAERIYTLVNSISDPIKKVQALVIAEDLVRLAGSRSYTSFALEELLTDPEERASYINRQRAADEKAVQDEIDKYAEEQIENTNTSAEIKAVLKVAQDKKLSPKAKKKLTDERDKRKLNEAAINQRLNEDDLSVLEVALAAFNKKAAAGTPLTPEEIVERHVLSETIKHRTKEGLIEGNRSRRAARKAAEDKKAAAEAAAAADVAEENKNKKEDQTKDASKGTTTAGSENTGDSRAPKSTTQKAQIQNGELATEDDKETVKFDDNGFPIEGNDKNREFKIDREYLKTKEGHDAALTSEVEFVLNNETFEKDGKTVTEAVIYVKLDGRYIGILPSPHGPKGNRQSLRVYMSLMEGNPTTGRISDIGYAGSGNFINEVKDGVPVLKPMSELFKDGKPEGFVTYGYVTEEGVEIVGEGVSEEVLNAASNAVSLRRPKNDLGTGQIVMIFKLPNGDYTAIPITTKETGVEGLAAIRQYILDSDVSNLENNIKAVAGLPIWQRGFSKFTVEVTEQGVPLISFFHKDKAVKLSVQEMRNLLEDKPVGKFSIGTLVTRTVEGQEVVVFENDTNASTADYLALKDGMRASFEEAVKSTKRQVDPTFLAIEGAYTDPVTKKVYPGGYAEFIESELLSTQVRFHKGLPTFDHKISIDLSIQNEQPKQAVAAAVVEPEPKGKPENKAAPEEPGVGQGSIHSSTEGSNTTGQASDEELAALEAELGLEEGVVEERGEPSQEELESAAAQGGKPYIDEEGYVYESIVDAIVDNSNNLELTEDGKYYRNKKTGKLYMRATTFIGSKETFDPKWSASATAIGNSVDQFLRDYFAGRVGSNSYPNLSQEAQDELSAAAENLQTLFEGRGEKVLEDDITLSFESAEATSKDGAVVGVAGTVDLMTQDKDGNFRIYDIKSLREATVSKAIYKNNKSTGTKGVRVTPEGKYGPRMDEQQRSTYQKQLSIYKALAENKFGVTVSEISVVPVDVRYPSPENKTVEEASNTQATSAVLINPIVQKPLTIKGLEPGKQSETSTESAAIDQRFAAKIENLSILAEMAFMEGDVQQADKLLAEQKEAEAEYKKLTGKDYGGSPFRLASAAKEKIDKERAIAWLRKRFGDDAVTIYDQLKMVGDNIVHGYMENGAVHLFSQAEVGTEYHEGFHLFFRTLLTNRQRADLYQDAADMFGEPTAEDIAKARRGQREMTDEEARNLALEEKLAEEFRDFVLTEQKPKTMGKRIAKFFKDLLIYIKALAGYPMTVRSAFSMIESNRIPKSYSRTAQTFSPGGTAFLMQHFVSDPKLGKEIRDLVVYKVIKSLDANSEVDIQDLLGSPATANVKGGESAIADWFLRSALKVNAPLGSRALKDKEFEIIKKVYSDPEKMVRAMNVMHVQFGSPDLTFDNEIMPDQMTVGDNSAAYSKLFLEVYEHWHDKRSELGGVEVRGYRSEIRDRLRDYGLKTYDTELTRKAEDIADNDEGADRVYSVSRSKEDPAKTLGDKARRALSRIPVQNTEASRLGFQTFIPIEDVYKQVAATVVDATDWVQMLSALEEKANEISALKEVYDFMVKLDAKEKALMYSVFAQAMTPYKLIKLEIDDNGNKVVKIINSSENSIQRYFAQKWKDESTGSGGLYTPGINSSGDLLDLRIDEERRAKAESLYGELETAMQKTPDGVKQYELLGELLLEMGITIASNKKEAGRRVQIAFEKDKIGMYNFLTKDTKIRSMFTGNGKMTKKILNNYSNIFETESSTMNAVSQIIMSKFEAPSSTSFFNGTGNLVYPINLKSDMNITTELIKSEGEDNLAAVLYGKETEGGVVGSVVKGSDGDTRSLAHMFISNKNGKELFELVDIDSFAADENAAKEFDGFTYKDGLAVDLVMFAQSNKVRYIAVDTQGDRSKLTYMPVPNFRNSDVAAMYGFDIGQESDPIAAGIERTYLLDLHRMYVAEKAKSESPVETYHSRDRYLAFQLGGPNMDPESNLLVEAYVHLEKGTPMSPELKKAVKSYVSDTKKRMTQYRQDIVAELGGEGALQLFVTSTIKGGSKGNYGGYIKGEEIAYIDEFIEMSVLGRMMSREILRSGVNYVKNGADYVKRSALSSTPGTQLFTISMNNDPNNADYGMLDEFKEITLNDIFGSIPSKDRADLKEKLVDQVGEAAAEGIISAYDRSNGTDAQAVISIDMYRRLRMGLGQWTAVDEQVYKEYMSAPIGQRKWDGTRSPIMPLKPSYDYRVEHTMGGHRHLLPISHKNSYVVLTDELAEGIPNLQNLAQYFETNNVHVANTISAKKLASFQPVDITDLASATIQTVPSRGLKFPQILPSKKAQKITFGRQPRKNMIANINPETSYYLEDMGMEVSGRDLINMYQKAVIAKLNKGHASVFSRLGYDKVLEAREKGDTNKEAQAMQAMLPKLREALTELGIEKDLPQNIMDSVNVIVDANGVITTEVPLSFPTVQNKLDSLIMGLFRSSAYLQKLTGVEMVQFAEFGESQTDKNLNFYSIEEATDSEGNTYSKVAAAEVDIRRDVLEAMGVDPDASISEIEESVNKMLGYRIPQQGKSSMLMMKIRKVLPNSHSKAVRIPPSVTTMMGSDFDIDKMFVIFPEVNIEGKKQVRVTKVKPDYNALKNSTQEQFEELDEKVLNNIVFDTFMAIGSNVNHIHETMTPLDIEEGVDPILQGIVGIGYENPHVEIDINNPHDRIRSATDNMLSMALRGIYANTIAGRNVALTAMSIGGFTFTGPQFKVDGVTVGNLVEKSLFPDPLGVYRFTDYYMSGYLSKSVDSVKDPVQRLMNDNSLTAPLTSYMLSIGMTPQQAIAFLNVGAVKEVIDSSVKHNRSIKQGLIGYKPIAMNLNLAEMQAIASGANTEYNKSDYMKMLSFINEEAKKLRNLYTILSPDNIDQAGTTPQHLAKVERALTITQQADDIVFGGREALKNVTEGEAYPIVKAYYAAINRSVELTTALGFIGTQPAVTSFKEDVKKLSGLDYLNDVQHRDINRAILHHLVTKPGSPIFEKGLLDAPYIRDRFTIRGGLESVMNNAKKAAGETVNPVFDAFTLEQEEVNGFPFYYLKVDKTKLSTKEEKDRFTYTMQGMMDNSGLYGEENRDTIRDGIRVIITNSIITSGFAPGMKSYFELIPVSFWRELGVTEHLNQEISKLNTNKRALDDFKVEFLMNYGTHSARRETLFPRDKGRFKERFLEADNKIQDYISPANDAFRISLEGNKKILYQRSDRIKNTKNYKYIPVATKGKQYVLYEAYLREPKTGKKVKGSLFDNEQSIMLPRPSAPYDGKVSSQRVGTGQRETPKGAAEKVARLRENFAAAGIDVKVVETELPLGTKGQVQGDTVYVDPSQMETDTVYHEFAHILIDMMPEDQVDAFVEQVIKAEPSLAKSVQSKYPELEGRELGKEILVTAIGLQGAKIERNKPSKLRVIINKILRALGKVFGVSPNVAAVLAEKMFVGDMRAEGLSGQFNPKIQKSKDLKEKMGTVYKQVRDSLARQRFRLNQLAETENREAKIRELDGLIQNIDELNEKAESKITDLNEFYDFYEYVVGRTEILNNMMEDLLEEVKNGVPLTRDEMFSRLNKIDSIRQTLESLYTEDESTSTVVQMTGLLRTLRDEGDLENLDDEVKELLFDLSESMENLRDLNKMYMDTVVPLTTNALLSYASPEAAAQIEAEKKRIIESNDLSGFRPMRVGASRAMSIPEFKALNSEYYSRKNTDSAMSREEFNEKAMEIKLRYIENKMVGAAQITQELTEAQKSKSKFSYWLDPIVYSRQQNLQLFALAVKDALYRANEDTINFTYDLESKYNDFKEWKGGSEFNQDKLNEDILTTVRVRKGDKTIKALSLVQEFDIDKYYSNYYSFLDSISTKYNKPSNEDSQEVWKEWYKSSDGKNWAEAKQEWFAENTEPVEGAEEKFKSVIKEMNAIEDKMKMLEVENNPRNREQLIILRSDFYKLQARRKKMGYYAPQLVDGQVKFIAMGELAKPKAKDESGNRMYLSEKYEKIMNTPELKQYYEFIVSEYHKAQAKLGNTQQQVNNWDKYSYVMPTIRKDGLGTLFEDGWKELAKEQGRDFRRLDTDTEFGLMTEVDGQEIRGIPKYYTQVADEKNVSRDVAASMTQFIHMSNNYQQKSSIAGLVHSMLVIHEKRGVIKHQGGLPIRDQIAGMSRRANELVVSRDESDNNDLKHLRDFIESVFYGVSDTSATLGSISQAKTAGKLVGATAVVGLAGNLLQIGNQAILDNLMTAQEAFAKQFFTPEDWGKAIAIYTSEGAALRDVGSFVPKGKLAKAMQMFDALNEVTDSLGQNIGGNKARKLFSKDTLFALQHGVEHETAGIRMLAVMTSTKVKDKKGEPILNEDGSEANLWDMLVEKENGQLTIDPRVANVNKSQVIAKIHGIAKRTNQVKGSFDSAMAQRTTTGKLLLLFRNYFIPGLRRRYGHGDMYQVDHELGEVTKGYYQTFANSLRTLVETGDLKAALGSSEIDKQNMKRVAVDVATIAGTMLLYTLMQGLIDDDDEDYTASFIAYQAKRLQTEVTGFFNPVEAVRMAARPMATVNFIEDYLKLAESVLYTAQYETGIYFNEEKVTKGALYQRRSGPYEKGDYKLAGRINKVMPLLRTWKTVPWADGSAKAVQDKLRWFS